MPTARWLPRSPFVLRYFWKTDVTICIPAYQAAKFIDRTLRCAQGQTYRRLRILVSVDRSTDDTVSICRDFAALDPRIDIIEHGERQGWCGNVNALLENVDTAYFFVYFHDDLILPQYSERLRKALLVRPDAASAHCDLVDFGIRDAFKPGCSYDGPIARRLMTFWAAPERGTPLRSIVRSSRVGRDYRLPAEERNSYTPGSSMMMLLMAAGPAVRIPETLYLRWQRKGGLVDGWGQLSFERMLSGWQDDVGRAFSIIEEKVSAADDRHAVKFAVTLKALLSLTHRARTERCPAPQPRDIHPNAPELAMPNGIERFGSDIADHLRSMLAKLRSAPA